MDNPNGFVLCDQTIISAGNIVLFFYEQRGYLDAL